MFLEHIFELTWWQLEHAGVGMWGGGAAALNPTLPETLVCPDLLAIRTKKTEGAVA